MKVLFVYPKSNPLISRHVSMLTDGLQQSVSVGTADSVGAIRKAVKEQEPDIIHCHGCPSVSAARAILSGINKGSRLVLTLHGQMEPWATDKNKNVPAGFWHKKLITRAYSVILLGRLELTNFQKLGWNRRTEEIHNAVTTNTISQQEMCTATFAVYQKVMDSNTLELMDEPTVRMLRAVVKVGIMGDRRWTVVLPSEEVNWRHLLLYAEHENITASASSASVCPPSTPHASPPISQTNTRRQDPSEGRWANIPAMRPTTLCASSIRSASSRCCSISSN